MRIYFAGKIAKHDWRADLFGDRIGSLYGSENQDQLLDPEYVQRVSDGIVYGGPFFISCDHGCAHGTSTHGVGKAWVRHNLDGNLVVCAIPLSTSDKNNITRSDIFQINNTRIQRADWVFAHIDSFNAYGTFFEIGFAYANKIPVAISLSENLSIHGDLDDLWYMIEGAQEVYRNTTAKASLNKFCRDYMRKI